MIYLDSTSLLHIEGELDKFTERDQFIDIPPVRDLQIRHYLVSFRGVEIDGRIYKLKEKHAGQTPWQFENSYEMWLARDRHLRQLAEIIIQKDAEIEQLKSQQSFTASLIAETSEARKSLAAAVAQSQVINQSLINLTTSIQTQSLVSTNGQHYTTKRAIDATTAVASFPLRTNTVGDSMKYTMNAVDDPILTEGQQKTGFSYAPSQPSYSSYSLKSLLDSVEQVSSTE